MPQVSHIPDQVAGAGGGLDRGPDLSRLMRDFNIDLERYFHAFEAAKSCLVENLYDDEKLHEKEMMTQAARSVDLLYKIQQLLDSPTLVLADHFLGEFAIS